MLSCARKRWRENKRVKMIGRREKGKKCRKEWKKKMDREDGRKEV